MLPSKNKQEGSGALAGIMALAVIAMGALYVQHSQQTVVTALNDAKVQRSRESTGLQAGNTFSRFKALMATRFISKDLYVPAVYAANYYDEKEWALVKSPRIADSKYAFSSAGGRIEVTYQEMSNDEIAAVMNGTPSKMIPKNDSFEIKIASINRESDKTKPGYGVLVNSVDVQVKGSSAASGVTKTTSETARILLTPPTPREPKIMYRPAGGAGAWKEIVDGADLSTGKFEFQITSSGVAFSASVLLDGAEKAKLDGVDKDGNIISKANNYEAKDQAIGEPFPLALKAEKADASASSADAPADDGSTDSFNIGICKYIPGGGATGATSGGGSSSATRKIQAIVYGPDGVESAKTDEFTIKVEAPPAAGGGGGTGGGDAALYVASSNQTGDGTSRLSQDDYKNMCSADNACPYVTTDAGDGSELGRVASYFRPKGDISSYFTFKQGQDPGKWDIFQKKVCFNFAKVDNSSHALNFDDADVIVYDVKSCSRKFLFVRSSCGCLTGDTQIVMEDGKRTKRIDEIVESDLVWNPILRRAMPLRKMTRGPEKPALIELRVGERTLNATQTHPFNTRTGIKPASRLAVGEEILMNGGVWAAITGLQSIEPGEALPIVWNLEIEAADDDLDSHQFVANGITTGDLMIQTKLQNQSASSN